MVVNKVKETFLLHTEKRTRFIYSILLSMSLMLGHVYICVAILRHSTYTYLLYYPPHSVYSYVILCCYYIGCAFHLISPCPAITQLLVGYAPHGSWLLSITLSVWQGQTLT